MTANDYIKSIARYFVPASYQEILRALEYEDLTVVQLSERLNADRTTVHKALGKMSEWGVIHICEWIPPATSGQWLRVYRIGKGANKRRPQKKSNADVCREYRARNRRPQFGVWSPSGLL